MPLRVLIVEDDPVIALNIEAILEDAGHTVVGIVPDMEGALRVATERRVDVATVDVILARRSDGVETARRLEVEHGVRSVFVSAVIDRAKDRSTDFDPVGFVDKPFREKDILRILADLAPRPSP